MRDREGAALIMVVLLIGIVECLEKCLFLMMVVLVHLGLRHIGNILVRHGSSPPTSLRAETLPVAPHVEARSARLLLVGTLHSVNSPQAESAKDEQRKQFGGDNQRVVIHPAPRMGLRCVQVSSKRAARTVGERPIAA